MANMNTPPPAVTSSTSASGADGGNKVRSLASDDGLGRSAQSDVISTLNDLIETSKDGEKGFALAAKDAKDPGLVSLFREGEQSCREAARELQEQVRALGGNPDESGSVSGAVHRGWVNLKTAATSRDDKAILEEVERGEDFAKARYAAALKTNLPDGLRQLVERQYQGALSNHDRVRDLRNQYQNR